ncbi:hypothetical protein N9Y42_02010 [Mariniblastus sp.]|nr:hypothetical protein [Mariniblastus sp.]
MHSFLLFIQSTFVSLFSYLLARLNQLDGRAFLEAAKPALRAAGMTVLILSLVSITGCGGCQSKEEKEKQAEKEKLEKKKKEKEKKKRKKDFESMAPVVLPGILNDPIKMKRRESKLRNDPMQKEIDKLRSLSLRKNYAKPGHWQDIRFQANANHYDIEGELYAGAIPSGASNRFLPVEGTKYTPITKRLAALPKGKWKTFDSSLFIPLREESHSMTSIRCGFNRANGASTNFLNFNSVRSMAPDQHHLVLLTNRQDKYQYLEAAPTVKMPGSDATGRANRASYVIIPSDPQFPVPLPRHGLYWSTIAYLIWDDLDPDRLDLDQQTAMIDWLHFGGQLILSGPDCVQRLEKSFLADYLPARADKAVNLTSEDLTTLNSKWSLPEKNARGKNRELQILDTTPLLGVNFQIHADAQFIEGSGDLVVERQLGRGRIVATSFSLAAPAVRSWRSFDSFLNNVLLRRPVRTFYEASGPYDFGDTAAFRWKNDSAPMREPLLHSSLRFLSRDLAARGTARESSDDYLEGIESDLKQPEVDDGTYLGYDPGFDETRAKTIQTGNRNLSDHWHYGGFDFDPQAGVGGWSDFDAVADSARSTLQDAAGITPPSGNFVLKLLAGYLFVLVPLNWAIFWMLGKVEYAWIAAPIIAIVGALVVIRMASLDIGFSRSNTQIALLEIPAEYERGHLTEYSALYTSLSTSYRMELDGKGGLALPFPSNRSKTFRPSELVPLTLDKTTANTMSGVQIQSNTTELIHAENMFDAGGKIRIQIDDSGEITLINGTNLTFKNVLIAGGTEQANRRKPNQKSKSAKQKKDASKRDQTPAAKLAMIESIAPNTQIKVTFGDTQQVINDYRQLPLMANAQRTAKLLWVENFDKAESVPVESLANLPELQDKWSKYSNWFSLQLLESDETEVSQDVFMAAYERFNPSNAVSLGKMFDCVFDNLKLSADEYRMFASTNEKLGQTEIDPSSTQTDRQTLVVAHLSHPSLPKILRDSNSAGDLKVISDLDSKNEQDSFEIFE